MSDQIKKAVPANEKSEAVKDVVDEVVSSAAAEVESKSPSKASASSSIVPDRIAKKNA